jgi:hypothetical protein
MRQHGKQEGEENELKARGGIRKGYAGWLSRLPSLTRYTSCGCSDLDVVDPYIYIYIIYMLLYITSAQQEKVRGGLLSVQQHLSAVPDQVSELLSTRACVCV